MTTYFINTRVPRRLISLFRLILQESYALEEAKHSATDTDLHPRSHNILTTLLRLVNETHSAFDADNGDMAVNASVDVYFLTREIITLQMKSAKGKPRAYQDLSELLNLLDPSMSSTNNFSSRDRSD